MLRYYALCFHMTLVYYLLNLFVYSARSLLTVSPCMCKVSTYKYLVIIIFIVDKAYFVGETKAGNHGSCNLSCVFDVARSPCGDIVKDELLRHTSSKCYYDILPHPASCVKHFILLRKRHGVACSTIPGRYNRNGIHRSYVRKYMEEYSVSRFVISSDSLFLF